jgi:hypothetical protein
MVRFGLLLAFLVSLGCGGGDKIIPPTNPVTIEKPGKNDKPEKRGALPTTPNTPKSALPANKSPSKGSGIGSR